MSSINLKTLAAAMTLFAGFASGHAQNVQKEVANEGENRGKIVVVTGARFSYPLIEKWIDQYQAVNPDIQIIVESRGSSDPANYDILAEVYEHPAEIAQGRDYVKVGKYAVLPVANTRSALAAEYADKGLNADLIERVFFHGLFSGKEYEKLARIPFTTYTRLQKAGVPSVFAKHFGYQQKDLKGKAIAGADAHMLKALLRDSSGVTYLPLPLIYDQKTRQPLESLVVLPVDLDGNKKVTDEEKIFGTLDNAIESLEVRQTGKLKNIPIEYLHLSVDRTHATPEAKDFIKWVQENGQDQLHTFGYLQVEASESANRLSDEHRSAQPQ